MRAFIAACLAAIVLAVIGYFSLNALQRASGIAFTTESSRIDPSWTERSLFMPPGKVAEQASTTVA